VPFPDSILSSASSFAMLELPSAWSISLSEFLLLTAMYSAAVVVVHVVCSAPLSLLLLLLRSHIFGPLDFQDGLPFMSPK